MIFFSTTEYSPEYHHETLLKLPQYIASPDFKNLGEWDVGARDAHYIVKNTLLRNTPVKFIMVFMISGERAYLEAHGNYNPDYPDSLRRSKLQVICQQPLHVPPFDTDYTTGYAVLKQLQDEVARTAIHEHCLLPSGKISLNFPLFTPRVSNNHAPHLMPVYSYQITFIAHNSLNPMPLAVCGHLVLLHRDGC